MFLKLALYEMKYYLKNITFYVILALSLLFLISQGGDMGVYPEKPKPPEQIKSNTFGLSPYGYKKITDPQKIMEAVYMYYLDRSVKQGEVSKNYFIFNKTEKLDEKQLGFIKETMKKIVPQGGNTDGTINIDVPYDEFWKLLDNLDRQLGGRTEFARQRLENSLTEPKTYEEALQSYRDLTVKDRYTRATARLMADYGGIVFGILPVFLAAFIFLRDKRSKSEELLFSRKVNGFTYVGAKFAGLCAVLLTAVLLIAGYFTAQAVSLRIGGFDVDVFAFPATFMLWLVPTIMAVCALAMLISLLFKNFVPALVTGLAWWIASITPLEGNYSLYKLFIRHNTLDTLPDTANMPIAANRLFIMALALILVYITSVLWEKRRETAGEHIA